MSQGGAEQGLGLEGLRIEVPEGRSRWERGGAHLDPLSLSISLSSIPKIEPIRPFFHIYPRFHIPLLPTPSNKQAQGLHISWHLLLHLLPPSTLATSTSHAASTPPLDYSLAIAFFKSGTASRLPSFDPCPRDPYPYPSPSCRNQRGPAATWTERIAGQGGCVGVAPRRPSVSAHRVDGPRAPYHLSSSFLLPPIHSQPHVQLSRLTVITLNIMR